MKRLIFLLGLLLLSSAFTKLPAQTKHALIFGIGNYPVAGGWPVISSDKDVPFINRTLQKQGFLPDNIKTVVDAEATVEGIIKAINDLMAKVKLGDIVTIHFSSHGEQVEDNDGDEPDSLDETIVTYSAVSPRKSTDFKKDQAGYFRDDQFGTLVNQLRSKLGKNGDVLVFIDACHSGSGTRGIAKVRGNQPPLVSKNFRKNNAAGNETNDVFKEGNNTRGDERDLATYVVISASRPEELNTETLDDNKESMGSLTYSVSKVFENLEPGTSYRSVFAKIQTVMHNIVPGQHPVMEGNGADRTLFGGNYVHQKHYIEVESVNGNQMVVKGGEMAGLDVGAKVSVYTSGTNDPVKVKAIVSGIVTEAGYYNATVRLDRSPGEGVPASFWVFVTDPVYIIEPITIGFASPASGKTIGYSTTEQASIKSGLKAFPLLKFVGTPDLILVKGSNADSIKIAANGYVFNSIKKSETSLAEMKNEVQRYIQYKFLQNIEINDKRTNAEIKLVPVIHGKPDTTKINAKIMGGTYEYKEGDTLVIWVRNNSNEAIHVNVLDMQPNGIINPVFPNRLQNIHPYDLKVQGNSTRLFTNYHITISPPYGLEIFKVFVSNDEIDMEGIAISRGAESRGNFGVLEKLVNDSYRVAIRGTPITNVSNADGSVFNVLFRIIPRK